MLADPKNNALVKRTIYPQAAGTTGTGVTGAAVDRSGYAGVMIVASYGTIPNATETLTLTVMHGDTASAGAFSSVADADLIGTEADASIPAAARVSDSTKNVTKRIGYIGNKRYVKAKIVGIGTATALIAADVVLTNPLHAPAA